MTVGDLVEYVGTDARPEVLAKVRGTLGRVVQILDHDDDDGKRIRVHFPVYPSKFADRLWHCPPEALRVVYRAEDPT